MTLCEAAPQLGGLASAWSLGNVVWDRHYHVTLLSDTRLRGLLEEIGLEHQMRWVETKTGFYSGGQLHSMSTSLEFLRFPPLSMWERMRLGGTIFSGLEASQLEAAGKNSGGRLAAALVGPRRIREDLAAAVAGEAGRGLSQDVGRVHLGPHAAHVQGPPQRPEKGNVRLRAGRIRAHSRPAGRSAGTRRRRDSL